MNGSSVLCGRKQASGRAIYSPMARYAGLAGPVDFPAWHQVLWRQGKEADAVACVQRTCVNCSGSGRFMWVMECGNAWREALSCFCQGAEATARPGRSRHAGFLRPLTRALPAYGGRSCSVACSWCQLLPKLRNADGQKKLLPSISDPARSRFFDGRTSQERGCALAWPCGPEAPGFPES
jgi:hypothetical protein